MPGFYLLSIDDALKHKGDAIGWPRSWLPLFANDGGDYLIVDGESEKVIDCSVEDGPQMIHQDLRAFLLTTLACFEAGAFMAEPPDLIRSDIEKVRAVSRELNPEIVFWKDIRSSNEETVHPPTMLEPTSGWKRTALRHSISGTVDLFARESDGFLEIAIAGVDKKNQPTWFEHDRLRGTLADLHLDQRGTAISWQDTEPPVIKSPVSDMVEVRQRNGHKDGVDFLCYGLANAINASRGEHSFAVRAKKLIVGAWESPRMSISFRADGTYSRNSRFALGNLRVSAVARQRTCELDGRVAIRRGRRGHRRNRCDGRFPRDVVPLEEERLPDVLHCGADQFDDAVVNSRLYAAGEQANGTASPLEELVRRAVVVFLNDGRAEDVGLCAVNRQ